MPKLLFVFIVVVASCAMSCATSPTGRRQLILLPDHQMDSLGQQAFAQMLQGQRLEREGAVTSYVECVTEGIVSLVEGEGDWQLAVFADDSVNAFALPGGPIGVYRGLLRAATNQDQLATVIAHEVGHILARHGAERVSQALLLQGGLIAADVALQRSDTRPLIMAALGIGAQLGVLLPFSRRHEEEADAIGLQLMARAGFDPREAILLWENMATLAGDGPPQFLSTHPSPDTRIENLRAEMPKAMEIYKRARKNGRGVECARDFRIAGAE